MSEKLTFGYKKKQIRINLILGIIWMLNGLVQVWENDSVKWFEKFWFYFGLIYLGIYIYLKTAKYITIENGIIKQNWPFGKQLQLSEIKTIRHFAGDFILKTANKKLVINLGILEKESYSKLKEYLQNLDMEWS